jgi:hypothetical protein
MSAAQKTAVGRFHHGQDPRRRLMPDSSEKSPRMIHSARAGRPSRARSSSMPCRRVVRTLPSGPVTWAMRLWPSACRCRIASRAPSALSARMTGKSAPSTHSHKKHDPPAEPGLDAGLQRPGIDPAIERDHPVDPPVEEIAQKLPLPERAAFGIGDEHGIVAVGEPVARSGEDVGIERLAKVGHEDQHRARPLHAQVPRRLVDPVAGGPDRIHHRRAGPLGQEIGIAERTADRGRGNARGARHVLDGGRSLRPSGFRVMLTNGLTRL